LSNRAWLLGITGFLYFVLLGGTPAGDIVPALRTINAAVGAALIVIYFLRAPRVADRIDRMMLLGLVLFLFAGAFSMFPRQSFDAALAATAYIAAFFLMRGAFADESARRLAVAALATLSLILSLFFASLWFPEAIAWYQATNEPPPLALRYPSLWWGHRYDVGLMLLLLAPAWWIGKATPLRFALGTVTTVITVGLVILTGSRTLWLAAVVASLYALTPAAHEYVARHPTARRAATAAGLLVAIGLAFTGVGAVIVDRALASETVVARGQMWLDLTTGALEHPVGGFGLGSFAWILQGTNYFDTNSWAPRHPDSAVFQLVAEGGLMGMSAAVAWIAAVAPSVWRSRQVVARWAIACFVTACIATSATDFGFLVIPALVWVALAAPRRIAEPEPQPTTRRSVATRFAFAGGGAVIALAFISMTVGMYAYGSAVEAIARGSLRDGRELLGRAIAADPAMGLYWRQRGALELLSGNPRPAMADLRTSIRINPYDDLAWRSLAVAEFHDGDLTAALAATDNAVEVQRSDPTNLLMSSWLNERAGRDGEALKALDEVVQAWPEVTGAPGWSAMLQDGATTDEVIARAADRWTTGEPSPQPPLDQIVWLHALGAIQGSVPGPPSNQLSPQLTTATTAVLSCADDAATLLDRVPESDRRSPTYWALLARQSRDDAAALKLHDVIASNGLEPTTRAPILNPLNENGSRGFSADRWGYRRRPIAWPDSGIRLPSPEWGYMQWIRDPTAAISESGLTTQLAGCS
jgi:tetratricopeptide (TPR) repeat protein